MTHPTDRDHELNKLDLFYLRMLPHPFSGLMNLWRFFFFKYQQIFSCFYNASLKEDVALYFNKLEFPSSRDSWSQVWLKPSQWFWKRTQKCKKFTDGRRDKQTDGCDQKVIRNALLSFWFRWDNKNQINYEWKALTVKNLFNFDCHISHRENSMVRRPWPENVLVRSVTFQNWQVYMMGLLLF